MKRRSFCFCCLQWQQWLTLWMSSRSKMSWRLSARWCLTQRTLRVPSTKLIKCHRGAGRTASFMELSSALLRWSVDLAAAHGHNWSHGCSSRPHAEDGLYSVCRFGLDFFLASLLTFCLIFFLSDILWVSPDFLSDILPGISSGILSGISSDILSDARSGTSAGRLSDILSGTSPDILCISPDILSGILSGTSRIVFRFHETILRRWTRIPRAWIFGSRKYWRIKKIPTNKSLHIPTSPEINPYSLYTINFQYSKVIV